MAKRIFGQYSFFLRSYCWTIRLYVIEETGIAFRLPFLTISFSVYMLCSIKTFKKIISALLSREFKYLKAYVLHYGLFLSLEIS